MSLAERQAGISTVQWAGAAIAVAAGSLVATWWQVAPSASAGADGYYLITYARGLRPRGLAGEAARLFGLTPAGFRWMLYAFHVGWAALLGIALMASVRDDHGRMAPWSGPAGALLIFLFVYNTPSFLAAGYEFVDPVKDFLLLAAALILFASRAPLATTTAAVLTVLAAMVHEIAVFSALAIAAFVWSRDGWKRAFAYAGLWGVATLAFLALARARAEQGYAPEDYVANTMDGVRFLYWYSVNLYGLALAAGALWLVVGLAYVRFVTLRPSGRAWRALVAAAMYATCFAPLIVAWDTNRIVATLWLPVLLLILDTRIAAAPGRALTALLAAAAAAQVFVPAAQIFKHTVYPMGCYSHRVWSAIAQRDDSYDTLPRPVHIWPPRPGEKLIMKLQREDTGCTVILRPSPMDPAAPRRKP